MKRRLPQLLLLFVAVAGLGLAQAEAGKTNPYPFWSSGCWALGQTGMGSTSPWAETRSDGWQCGYYKLSCWWLDGGIYYPGCPGWANYPMFILASQNGHPNTTASIGWHSTCDAGGSCPYAIEKSSLWP